METKASEKGEQMTEPRPTIVTGERLNQIILKNIRKFCEESSRHFKDDLLKYISSKEKAAG
jgi:hypothetical protein